jgi:hypothetical protein
MPLNLSTLKLSEMTLLGTAIRATGAGAQSTEEIAGRMVDLLYNEFIEANSGKPACALVRFYLTMPYGELDGELRAFGEKLMAGHQLSPDTQCLTLLATRGEKAAWNSRKTSAGHQTIPLPSKQVVQAIPMISQLITQLGLDVATVIAPDSSLVLELEQRTYNVFFVPDAAGSPYIPAQDDFVLPHGIRSVLGFGGLLPSGNVYTLLMFTKVPVSRATADIFRNAAMNVKVALRSFTVLPIFGSSNHESH